MIPEHSEARPCACPAIRRVPTSGIDVAIAAHTPKATRVSWLIPSCAEQVAAVRHRTADTLATWGLGTDPAVLIVSELTSNAIVYGAPPVRIALDHDPDSGLLYGAVCDQGQALPVHPEPGQMEELGEGGRGLWLVGMLATRWGVTRHVDGIGKSVWFVANPGTAAR